MRENEFKVLVRFVHMAAKNIQGHSHRCIWFRLLAPAHLKSACCGTAGSGPSSGRALAAQHRWVVSSCAR